MLNLGKFHNIVRLVAFCPFASSQVALENANAVSEGESATTKYFREISGGLVAAALILVGEFVMAFSFPRLICCKSAKCWAVFSGYRM